MPDQTTEQQAIDHLRAALKLLMQRLIDEGGRGVELADAVDHTRAALDNLGYKEEVA